MLKKVVSVGEYAVMPMVDLPVNSNERLFKTAI